MRRQSPRVGAALLLFLTVVPARALASAIDFRDMDAAIVWDGTGDVVTHNDVSLGSATSSYASLGSPNPSQLVVRLTSLTANPPGPVPLQVNRVALFMTFDTTQGGTCSRNLFTCDTLAHLFQLINVSSVDVDPVPSAAKLNSAIVPFFAVLQGPSVAQLGATYTLTTMEQNDLTTVLALFSNDLGKLRVGIRVELATIPLASNEQYAFTATAVPEPATYLLLASGLGLVAARRRTIV